MKTEESILVPLVWCRGRGPRDGTYEYRRTSETTARVTLRDGAGAPSVLALTFLNDREGISDACATPLPARERAYGLGTNGGFTPPACHSY